VLLNEFKLRINAESVILPKLIDRAG